MAYRYQQQKLAKEVTVWTSSGRFLFRCHAEEALRMLTLGTVEPMAADNGPGKRGIRRLTLLATPQSKVGPSSDLTPASYQGSRTVYKERLGHRDAYAGHWTYNLARQSEPLQVLEVTEVFA